MNAPSEDPFAQAEAWGTTTDTYLGNGNHRVRILEAEGGTSSKQNPQITLKFGNADGTIKGWERYHAGFLGRVVELFECAGVGRPKPGEYDPADNCRISGEKLVQLVGKEVGIVVRPEKGKAKDGTEKEWPTVQGYVRVEQIEGAAAASAAGKIPF